MSNSTFEELVIDLGRLMSRKSDSKKKSGDDEGGLKHSENHPGALAKEDSKETDSFKGEIVRKIDKLGKSERAEIVRVLKRLKKMGSWFKLFESGGHAFLWIGCHAGGEELRRSIIAPDGVGDLLRRAGISGGATNPLGSGREQVQVA